MTVRVKFVATILALLSVAALAAPSCAQAQAPAAPNPRIALIVGEAAYPDHPLATSANDAGLIAQTLQAAGFDVVGARDLDQNALRGALRDFLDKAAAIGPDAQAFVYLAGRGVQYDGDNYFIPIDARIARDTDIPIQAVKISDFSHALAASPGRARIVVIDAARANFFAAEASSLAGGLGLVDAEDGTLMAFNAAPGTVAPDEPGPYGVYGKSLAGAMRAGGLPIDDVFAQTRLQVNQQTNGAVVPWSVSKIQEPYAIFERAADAPAPPALAAAEIAKRPLRSLGPDEAYAVVLERDSLRGYEDYLAAYPQSPQARRVRAILAARREALFWRRSVDENSPGAYWTYLRAYPKGPHVADARRRLRILSAEYAPPQDFAPEDYADLPPPPPDELVYDTGPAFIFDRPDYGPPPAPPRYFLPEEDEDWRRLPPPPPPAGLGFLPVLPLVAIPLLLGARAHHKPEPLAQQGAGAPPPLPPGFKPHDHAPAAVPSGPAPAGVVKPLPVVPGAAAPAIAAKPLPAAPGAPNTMRPAGPGQPASTPSQPVVGKPVAAPTTTVQKPSKPEFKAAPLQTSPAQQAAPVQHAAPAVQQAAPVQHAAPAAPQAAPVQHAAPAVQQAAPVQHAAPAAPQAAPVQHAAPAAPQAAPVQHAAPPAGAKKPACGGHNEPSCPK